MISRISACLVTLGLVDIRLSRAYEAPGPDDGYRVLVDRLWPRGRKKADLALDAWTRDLAPSAGTARAAALSPSESGCPRRRSRARARGSFRVPAVRNRTASRWRGWC